MNTLLKRLAAGAALSVIATLAHAGIVAFQAPSTLQQAVSDGQRVFTHDSFGSQRTFSPNGAMHDSTMTCAACHGSGSGPGRTPGGAILPSLAGAAARYPAQRGGAVVTLEEQVRRCIAGAVGGTPPAPDSPEMVDLISYLTALSKGAPLGPQLPSP